MPLPPSLKRPRETHSPSPSSTSSKRAASEDPLSASSDSGRPDGLLSPPNMSTAHLPGHGSSPLRQGSSEPTGRDEQMDMNEDGEWVRRTGEVHIASEGPEEGAEAQDRPSLQEQYSQLLTYQSPPYEAWEEYYIVPAKFFNALKALAHSDAKAESAPLDSLKLDLLELIQDEEGELVQRAALPPSSDSESIKLKKRRVWRVKEGLSEHEDFQFIAAPGWDLMRTWYDYSGPDLLRYALPGDRIQMQPSIFNLYAVMNRADDSTNPLAAEPPLRLSLPTDAPLTWLLGALKTLNLNSNTGAALSQRLWLLDTPDPVSSEPTLPALKSTILPPQLLPSLGGKLVLPNLSAEALQGTIASAGIENGDTFAVEFAEPPLPFSRDQPRWLVDVGEQGQPVERVIGQMVVPKAPPPLFSKPAFYPGSGNEASSSTAGSSSASSSMQTRSQAQRHKKGKGLVGLVNLGNTCFMASAVQCLSNTEELSEYFLSGVYQDELNRDNPLGMSGAVAEAFGTTIETLWSPSSAHSSYSPRQLKYTTSRFAPQFAGYGQQDSQEFIAFLLDGLHEDLNRIKKKPYIEKPDWKPGGGNKELAELGRECWEGYKKRNDSVIVDLFQGQLMSTLVCPDCHKESITMDPFMYLTVPMPIAQHRVFKCRFLSRRSEDPLRVKLLIPQNASFLQVKEILGRFVDANPSNMVMYDLWKGGPYAWFNDSDHNAECKDSDVAVISELAVPVVSTRKVTGTPISSDLITVPVYTLRSTEQTRGSRHDAAGEGQLLPFFMTLTKAEAADAAIVREKITKGYDRLVKKDMREALWTSSTSAKAKIPSSQEENVDLVTEIHLDGDQARIIETTSRPDGSTPSSPTPLSAPILRANLSSTSLSTLASVKSAKGHIVPRADLYKVFVAEAESADKSGSGFNLNLFKKENVIPLYKGSGVGASSSWTPLESRRKPKKSLIGHLSGGFKSMMSAADDESTAVPSPPGTPKEPPLLVRPGEAIFVDWEVRKFNEFFESGEPSHDWEEIVDPAIAKEAAKRKEGKAVDIEDCLDEFQKEETLGQEDLWYCPVCKKHVAANKKLEIYKAPDILVICIKRFGSARNLRDKLDNLVNFPIEGLDLSERIGETRVAKSLQLRPEEAQTYGIDSTSESMIYDLYAVDNHFGGMGGGHYTAFAKNRVDGQWYNYDDSRVSPANPESVRSRAAYLLFYRRRTDRPIGGISRVKAEAASRAATPGGSPALEPTHDAPGPSRLGQQIDIQSLSPPMSVELSPASSMAPSPTVSDNGDADGLSSAARLPAYDETWVRTHPSTITGADVSSIGYGNTAWGVSSLTSSATHATTGTAETEGTGQSVHLSASASSSANASGLPTPPQTDEEFLDVKPDDAVVSEEKRKQANSDGAGSEEDWQM